MNNLTMLAQMSPLFGLTGLARMGEGMVIIFGYVLFLLMASTAVVGLTLRSRLVVLASLMLVLLLGLLAVTLCFATVEPTSYQYHDPDCDYWAEQDRRHGTIWAWGLVVFVPVVIAAVVRAFRQKVSDSRELAAVAIVFAISALPLIACGPIVPLAVLVVSFALFWSASQMAAKQRPGEEEPRWFTGGPEDPAVRVVKKLGGRCLRPPDFGGWFGYSEPRWLREVVGNPVVEVELSSKGPRHPLRYSGKTVSRNKVRCPLFFC